jgi:dTDP-4-dehydrorhamnose 3,5-epimerase
MTVFKRFPMIKDDLVSSAAMRLPVSRLDGLQQFTARQFPDERGSLLQSYRLSVLLDLGIDIRFKQAIQSRSRRGVIRGLHFQWDPPQGKLIRCVTGAILDVVVDVRPGSPTLGEHAAVELSQSNDAALWVPPGFAHGFSTLIDDSIVLYECTEEWNPHAEGGILWSDPALGIEWPALPPILSPKDRLLPTLSQWLQMPQSLCFQ